MPCYPVTPSALALTSSSVLMRGVTGLASPGLMRGLAVLRSLSRSRAWPGRGESTRSPESVIPVPADVLAVSAGLTAGAADWAGGGGGGGTEPVREVAPDAWTDCDGVVLPDGGGCECVRLPKIPPTRFLSSLPPCGAWCACGACCAGGACGSPAFLVVSGEVLCDRAFPFDTLRPALPDCAVDPGVPFCGAEMGMATGWIALAPLALALALELAQALVVSNRGEAAPPCLMVNVLDPPTEALRIELADEEGTDDDASERRDDLDG